MVQVSRQLREYHLQEKLGEGGMGAVFKAVHQRLRRTVAIKVLPPGRMKDPQAVARFEREMQAVGRLDHPNIVRATDAGEDKGIHFLVMEFVAGEDLSRCLQCHGGRLPTGLACEYVRQAALGLQHVHENRLVHRDIKPSNLMVTSEGVVKILDLGLAQLRPRQADESAPGLTSQGSLMGTMDYVAPEQLNNPSAVDIRADIYSLGCTLYHLLSGRVPFPAPTIMQKIAAHQMAEPDSLAALRPDLPPAVVQVVQRMMAKDLSKRYPTPLAVAQALQPFAQSPAAGSLPVPLPVSETFEVPADAVPVALVATLPGANTQTLTRSRTIEAPRPRRRFPLVLVGLLLLALAGVGAFLFLQTPKEVVHLEFPQGVPENLEILVDGNKVAFRKVDGNRVEVSAPEGQRTIVVRDGERVLSEKQVEVGGQIPPVQVTRGPGPAPVPPLPQEDAPDPVGPVLNLAGHAYAILSVDFSPDGRQAVSGSQYETVVWDLKKRKLEEKLTQGFAPLRYTPDGKYLLLAGTRPANLLLQDLTAKKEASSPGKFPGRPPRLGPRRIGTQPSATSVSLEHSRPVTCLTVSPDSRKLVTGTQAGTVRVWELPVGKLLREFKQEGAITAVALAPDGRSVLFGDAQGRVILWDLEKDRQERQFQGHTAAIQGIRFTADGRQAWTGAGYTGGTRDQTLRLWEVSSGRELRQIKVSEGKYLQCLAFSPDLRRALVGQYEGDVVLWDLESGRMVVSYKKHSGIVSDVRFSPGGKYALSGGQDKALWLYRLPD
jgi:serine/threonine protein kinase/WD40 repeat protein